MMNENDTVAIMTQTFGTATVTLAMTSILSPTTYSFYPVSIITCTNFPLATAIFCFHIIVPCRTVPFQLYLSSHLLLFHLLTFVLSNFFCLDSVRSCYVCSILDFRLFYIHTQFSTYKLTNELISQ